MKHQTTIVACAVIAGMAIAGAASAHQPRLEYNSSPSYTNPVIISDPSTSQAFYGELKGSPQYYKVTIPSAMDFHMEMLVPDVPGVQKNISAYLVSLGASNSSSRVMLDGPGVVWEPMYEEYSGDNYFSGPKSDTPLSAGTYLIQVYSRTNEGKYVLVVGNNESFPVTAWLGAAVKIPFLKTQFFGKSIWSVWEGKIGKVLVISFAVLILIVSALIAWLIVRRFKKPQQQKTPQQVNF